MKKKLTKKQKKELGKLLYLQRGGKEGVKLRMREYRKKKHDTTNNNINNSANNKIHSK